MGQEKLEIDRVGILTSQELARAWAWGLPLHPEPIVIHLSAHHCLRGEKYGNLANLLAFFIFKIGFSWLHSLEGNYGY